MNRFILTIAALLVASPAFAQRIVTHGSTDQSVNYLIIDETAGTPETGVVYNTSGIDLWYQRHGSAKVSITETTGGSLTTHVDNTITEIQSGVYEFDAPDAAFASGAAYVTFGGTIPGMIVRPVTVQLAAFDIQTATQSVNTAQISGDSGAADNLETMLDGTGGQTLTLKSLVVNNSTGNAVSLTSSGSNGTGLAVTGHGTGSGMTIDSGTGTDAMGLIVRSNNATGNAIHALSTSETVWIESGQSVGLEVNAEDQAIFLHSNSTAAVHIEAPTGLDAIYSLSGIAPGTSNGINTPTMDAIDDLPTTAELASEADIAQANRVEMDDNSTKLGNLNTRLTSARAGYLDYLNVGGNVATSGDVATVYNRLGAPFGATIAADIATGNASVAAVQAKLPSNNAKMAGEGASAKNLDQIDAGGGSGVTIPVNQVPVPASRTVTLEPKATGLVGDKKLVIRLTDDEKTYAVDFVKDLSTNGRLSDLVSVTPSDTDGLTASDDAEDLGVDKTQAKFKLTPVAAGTYTLRVVARYGESDGGGESTGVITVVVTE